MAVDGGRGPAGHSGPDLPSTEITAVAIDFARDFVRRHEGYVPVPYRCPGGFWTVGYGHRCAEDHPAISRVQAALLLDEDLHAAHAALDRLVHVPLGIEKMAALVSLIFNIGSGAFARSKCRAAVNREDWRTACAEIDHGTYGPDPLLGLVRRRHEERAMFWTGHPDPAPAPASGAEWTE